jgi:hypothetical protein
LPPSALGLVGAKAKNGNFDMGAIFGGLFDDDRFLDFECTHIPFDLLDV